MLLNNSKNLIKLLGCASHLNCFIFQSLKDFSIYLFITYNGKKKKKEGDQKEVSSKRRVNNPPFFFPASHPLLTKPCVDEESRNALRVIIFFTLKNLTGNYFLFQLQGQKMDSCLI